VLYVIFFSGKYIGISKEEEIVSAHFGEWNDNVDGQTEVTG
jgi:hypothetical protein